MKNTEQEQKRKIHSKLIKIAFLKSLPVMAGYIVLGIGFGILLKKAGYGRVWSFLMSFTIYAGSMQYVGVSLLTSGASLLSTALTTLVVNARHLFYGVSMIDKYKDAGGKKPYLIFSLTDETYSLLCTGEYPEDMDKNWYYFWVSLFNQSYWVLGSVLGSIIGTVIAFNTAGIEFSMTALFVTVFVEQWLSTRKHLPAIAGLTCSIVCLLFFGAESFLIPTMISITVVLLLCRKVMDVQGGGKHE